MNALPQKSLLFGKEFGDFSDNMSSVRVIMKDRIDPRQQFHRIAQFSILIQLLQNALCQFDGYLT